MAHNPSRTSDLSIERSEAESRNLPGCTQRGVLYTVRLTRKAYQCKCQSTLRHTIAIRLSREVRAQPSSIHPVIPSEASPPSSCHSERSLSAVILSFRAQPLRRHPVISSTAKQSHPVISSKAKRSREISQAALPGVSCTPSDSRGKRTSASASQLCGIPSPSVSPAKSERSPPHCQSCHFERSEAESRNLPGCTQRGVLYTVKPTRKAYRCKCQSTLRHTIAIRLSREVRAKPSSIHPVIPSAAKRSREISLAALNGVSCTPSNPPGKRTSQDSYTPDPPSK